MSATLAQLRSDPLSEHIWIAEIAYYDTVGLTSGTLYYSTKEFGTSSSDTPASQQYEARMQNGYNFSGGSSNSAVMQTNKHLQALVDIQAKALRDSANDRYRKPKFGYAGYAGGNSASRRS